MVGRTLLTVLAGTVAGATVALVASPWLRDALLTIRPEDTSTYLTVSGLVLAAAAGAALIPAARASRVDPARTLREDA